MRIIPHDFKIEKSMETVSESSQLMEEDKLYESEVETGWMCLNCGHVHWGTEAPKNAPSVTMTGVFHKA